MNYWDQRAAANQAYYDRASQKTLRIVGQAYDHMIESFLQDAERILANFESYFGLTRTDAMALLKSPAPPQTLALLRKRLARVKNPAIRRQIEARLAAPAYANRISRLAAIRESARIAAAEAADIEQKVGQMHMTDIVYEGFSRTLYDIQRHTGIGFGFAGADTARLKKILQHNWSGRMFSDRVWRNASVTSQTLAQALTECVLQGKTSRATFAALMDQSNGSRLAANRLLRTETNYLSNQAAAEAYALSGIERYRFMSVLDGRTSLVCQQQDGKEYQLSEKAVGVNYPPLHPWCRSCVMPVIDRVSLETMHRRARDPVTGEEMKVPLDMNYREWRAQIAKTHGEGRTRAAEKKIRNHRADLRQWEYYREIAGKRELPKTLEGFQEIKYNEPEKWWLMKGYVAGVRNNDLSTLTGFEHYQTVAGEVQKTLVGAVTSDGVKIKGFKTHFVDRVIGNYLTRREGVPLEDALDTVLRPKALTNNIHPSGKPSRYYIGDRCGVTVNPDTGTLIQTNPLRRKT